MIRNHNKNKKIVISAKDIFEYMKCKAFYKKYISSGRRIEECYTESYRKLIFQEGKEFEKSEIEKIPFTESKSSLKQSLKDQKTSILRIEPPLLLKRKIVLKKHNIIAYAIGRPDLITRDHKTGYLVPLEYKTSLRYKESTLLQLLHYCFLLRKYNKKTPNIGYITTKQISFQREKLSQYIGVWKKILEEIILLKIGMENYILAYTADKDFSLTDKCKLCLFYRECSNYFLNNLRFECISGVGLKYAEILKELGFESVEELAMTNPDQIVNRSKNSRSYNYQKNRKIICKHIVCFDIKIYKTKCKLLFRYGLNDNSNYILNPTFEECLDFLFYRSHKGEMCRFSYNLDFFISAILKTWANVKKVADLETETEVSHKKYILYWKKSEFFRLKKNKSVIVIYDLNKFLKKEKLLQNCLDSKKNDLIDEDLLNTSSSYWERNLENIIIYSKTNCKIKYNLAKDLVKKTGLKLYRVISQSGKIFGIEFATNIVNQAKALVKSKPIPKSSLFKKIILEKNDGIFDLEYDFDGTIFSISIGIINEKRKLNHHNWFAENFQQSKKIVKEFYDFLEKNKIKKLAGWNINKADIPKLNSYDSLPESIILIDALVEIKSQVNLPVISYSLKDIYHYLHGSNNLNHTDIQNGLDAVSEYHNFLKTEDNNRKNQLIEYNKEDVQKTFEIINWFNEKCEKGFKN